MATVLLLLLHNRDEQDHVQLFCVLSGSACLIHGSSADPQLQQLLHNVAIGPDCIEQTASTRACSRGCGSGSSGGGGVQQGTWRSVRDAVSTAGRKRSMASSARGMASSAGGLASSSQADALMPVPAGDAAAAAMEVQQQPLHGLSLGTAARWQSFW